MRVAMRKVFMPVEARVCRRQNNRRRRSWRGTHVNGIRLGPDVVPAQLAGEDSLPKLTAGLVAAGEEELLRRGAGDGGREDSRLGVAHCFPLCFGDDLALRGHG